METRTKNYEGAFIHLVNLDRNFERLKALLLACEAANLETPYAESVSSEVRGALKAYGDALGKGLRVIVLFVQTMTPDAPTTHLPIFSIPFDLDDAECVQQTAKRFFENIVAFQNTQWTIFPPEEGDQLLGLCVESLFKVFTLESANNLGDPELSVH